MEQGHALESTFANSRRFRANGVAGGGTGTGRPGARGHPSNAGANAATGGATDAPTGGATRCDCADLGRKSVIGYGGCAIGYVDPHVVVPDDDGGFSVAVRVFAVLGRHATERAAHHFVAGPKRDVPDGHGFQPTRLGIQRAHRAEPSRHSRPTTGLAREGSAVHHGGTAECEWAGDRSTECDGRSRSRGQSDRARGCHSRECRTRFVQNRR